MGVEDSFSSWVLEKLGGQVADKYGTMLLNKVLGSSGSSGNAKAGGSSWHKSKRKTRRKMKRKFKNRLKLKFKKRFRRKSKWSRKLPSKWKRSVKAMIRYARNKKSVPMLWVTDQVGYMQGSSNQRGFHTLTSLTPEERNSIYVSVVRPWLEEVGFGAASAAYPPPTNIPVATGFPQVKFHVRDIDCRILMRNVYIHPVTLHLYWCRSLKIASSTATMDKCITQDLINTDHTGNAAMAYIFTHNYNTWPSDFKNSWKDNFRIVGRRSIVFEPGQTVELHLRQPVWNFDSNLAYNDPDQDPAYYFQKGLRSLFMFAEGPPRHNENSPETPGQIGNLKQWFEYTIHKRANVVCLVDEQSFDSRKYDQINGDGRTTVTSSKEASAYTIQTDSAA